MKFNYDILRDAILEFAQTHGRGANAMLSKASGVDANIISRIARGITKKPTLETWDKLHKAYPDEIPEPGLPYESEFVRMDDIEKDVKEWIDFFIKPTSSGKEAIITEVMKVPIYDLSTGEPSEFSPTGHPKGQEMGYAATLRGWIDNHTFFVVMNDNSMAPFFNRDDLLLVTPEAPLKNGKLCFVAYLDEKKIRMVRRYYKYDNVIVLKADSSDKEQYPDIVLDTKHNLHICRITKSISYE